MRLRPNFNQVNNTFNQEKALVGVIVKTDGSFAALVLDLDSWTVAACSHQHFYAPRYTAAIIVNCHHQQTSYSNIRVVKDASVSGHLTSDNIH